MSLLEKIIFVSDATEPNRTYDDAERLNALAFSDLDQACCEVLEWTVQIVGNSGRYMDQDTVKALEWFRELMKDRSIEDSRTFAVFAAQVLDDKKGFDIVVLDVGSQSMFADYLIIAAGGSERQINALASEVEDRSEKNGRFVRAHRRQKWFRLDSHGLRRRGHQSHGGIHAGEIQSGKDLVRLRAD